MAATSSNFMYDIFVSYSHRDLEWVQNQLVPKLEDAGLIVCIDISDFQPGLPVIAELERAIAQSRVTLLVLTPNYLVSQWAEFEMILVQTLDPSMRQRRVIPIMLQQCELPLRIRMMSYVDLTQPEQASFQFKRLLAGLGVKDALPSTSLTESSTQFQDYNLSVLRNLLITALSNEELTNLCFDYFPRVYEEFSIGTSKNHKIRLLIEYCERHLEIGRLLAQIKESNPAQYARFEPHLQATE